MDKRNVKHTQGSPEAPTRWEGRRTPAGKRLDLPDKTKEDIENMKQGMKYSDEFMNTRCTK